MQTGIVYIQFEDNEGQNNSKAPESDRLSHFCPPTVVEQDEQNDYDDSFESSGRSDFGPGS